MGVPAALELIVKVRVRVEMNQRQVFEFPPKRPQDWVGDGVIASQTHRTLALLEQVIDRLLNGAEGIALAEPQVALIAIGTFCPHIDAKFRPRVGGIAS
jgi:hypothetical protein